MSIYNVAIVSRLRKFVCALHECFLMHCTRNVCFSRTALRLCTLWQRGI